MALDNSADYEALRHEIRDNLNEAALSIQAATTDLQAVQAHGALATACENIARAVECTKDATEHIFRVMENEHPGKLLHNCFEAQISTPAPERALAEIIGALLVFERDAREYRNRPLDHKAATYWARQWFDSVETIYKIVKKHLEAAANG